MHPTTFEDKFIAFVDILGFKDMVKAAEIGSGDLSHLLKLTKMLGSAEDRQRVANGQTICPQSKHISKDLSFKLTQVSDCVVISAEASPAGFINLVHHCFGVAMQFLMGGHQCRGVLTRGNIHHSDSHVIGTGYIAAFQKEPNVSVFRADEGESGTPFIQIEPEVVRYANECGDRCVIEMFQRMTKTDGTFAAIWPFEALANIPAAIVDSSFDPRRCKESVQRSRVFRTEALKQFEIAEERAKSEEVRRKIGHFKRGLQDVLARLDEKEKRLDDMISTGLIPYGTVFK